MVAAVKSPQKLPPINASKLAAHLAPRPDTQNLARVMHKTPDEVREQHTVYSEEIKRLQAIQKATLDTRADEIEKFTGG